jgi:hypothetical protein
MLTIHRVAIAALVFSSAAAGAVEITTTIAVPIEQTEVVVRAYRLDKSADVIEQRVRVPAMNALALHEGIWELRLADDRFWAPRVYAREGGPVTLPIWPAVPLRGEIKGGVAKFGVAFAPLDVAGVAGEADCKTDGSAWTCAIPPGHYDLRFFTRGSAPEFRWNIEAPGKLETPLQFVAGASLSGRLETVRGAKISLDGLQISLSGAQQRYTAKSNANGFFQFKGLPAGQYSLGARREGLAALGRSVTIVAGAAAELNTPLLLDRPKHLTVTLAPALDPELKPWRISLWAYGAGHRGLTSVNESTATPAGEWTASALIGGDYQVQIARADGGTWKSVDVTIGDADVNLPLTALGEHVRGLITLGDHPLTAKLSFGGEHGATLNSGEDGRFEGDVPPSESDERTIFVDADAARVTRTVRAKIERDDSGSRVTIRLPATMLMGRVLGADGSLQRDALIIVSSDMLGVHEMFSGDDGSFQVTGIDAGEYHVSAQTLKGEKSERVAVTLADDAPAEVELTLKSGVMVRGRVGVGETPVMQADIYGIPRDTQFAPFMPQTRTNESGRFELTLPPRTTIFDLVVVHPAFDIVLTRIAGQLDSVRHVVATQLGGVLTVDTTAPKDLLVRHGGGECWLYWLANAPGVNGVIESARVVLPRLEPGEYTVCSAKTNQCGHGYLPPFGTLALTIGSAKSR